jgi:peptidoglycan/LPS O-acetylase OafA/YrhL
VTTVKKLPPAGSLLLDVVRFGASVLVAIGHLSQNHFSSGWPDLTTRAVEAVAVFFVLSGFVIRYVTRLKYATMGEYWVDRASRIYSVVLPAVAFTIAVDLIAYFTNPRYYLANWGDSISQPWLRILTNLTFTSQLWSQSIALFSNGPFWSLSYECFYYVIYGCVFYLVGVKRGLWAAAIILLGGIHIFLLLPLWLLGCVLYELYTRLSERNGWRLHAVFAVVAAAGIAAWRPVVATIFSLKGGLTRLFWAHHHAPINLHWTLDYYRVGLPAAFLLLWGLLAAQSIRLNERSSGARAVRLLSEGTFPLYLFHFPIYVLIAALIPYDHANAGFKCGMLMFAVVAGVALAIPTNRWKAALRNLLRRGFLRDKPMPAARRMEAV